MRGRVSLLLAMFAPALIGQCYATVLLCKRLSDHRQGMQQHQTIAWGAGAAAGAAAVLTSMPADCVKTRIETSSAVAKTAAKQATTSGGLQSGVAAFFATGKRMWRKDGAAALYVGVWPRLADKVPSSMVYWLAVEAMYRLLEPHCPEMQGEG